MERPRKIVVKKERVVHTYSELWHASNCVLNAGVEQPKGSSWQFLSSAVLTAFAFEAYLNHVGPRTIECWEQLDRLPPWSKFGLLCETLGVKFPDGPDARPLQTIVKLLVFRNTIAHGRSLEIMAEPVLRDANDQLDAYLGEKPLTEWEKLIQTSDFAKRAREDVQVAIEFIHEGRTDNKEELFTFGLGYHGATLVDP
ncbi:MAG: hypothetical protein NTW42_06280 [Deltaproteobacteria bacterium]|nr:hypothetical protein [Deltaproteobacteria bacterium]